MEGPSLYLQAHAIPAIPRFGVALFGAQDPIIMRLGTLRTSYGTSLQVEGFMKHASGNTFRSVELARSET